MKKNILLSAMVGLLVSIPLIGAQAPEQDSAAQEYADNLMKKITQDTTDHQKLRNEQMRSIQSSVGTKPLSLIKRTRIKHSLDALRLADTQLLITVYTKERNLLYAKEKAELVQAMESPKPAQDLKPRKWNFITALDDSDEEDRYFADIEAFKKSMKPLPAAQAHSSAAAACAPNNFAVPAIQAYQSPVFDNPHFHTSLPGLAAFQSAVDNLTFIYPKQQYQAGTSPVS